MTGTAVAAGLLLAVLACALAFLPFRTAVAGAVIAAAATVVAAWTIKPVEEDIALIMCWVSLAIAAFCVFWPRYAQQRIVPVLLFCAMAGSWAGLVLGRPDGVGQAAVVATTLLLTFPAAICVKRGWVIAPRILTSWLLAVALLAGTIPHLVDHPGYVPDHRM